MLMFIVQWKEDLEEGRRRCGCEVKVNETWKVIGYVSERL